MKSQGILDSTISLTFFGRVRADTERNGILCGNYEIEILDALEKAFANATEINN